MSARIHVADKQIHIDPSIITYEENPATLSAWWGQRKRWSRGWMQVANRYLTRLPRTRALSPIERADALYTCVYAIVPALLVVGMPIGTMREFTDLSVRTYVPFPDSLLWALPLIAPVAVTYFVLLRDWRNGLREHHLAEFLVAPTLGLYLIAKTPVFVVAFIEEYLLRKPSVYVTTSRADQDSRTVRAR